jgi:cytochrome c-type biogenesis protein CcmH
MTDADRAYEKAAGAILCDCGCHPQSVLACACSHAEGMREAIAAEAKAGRTADEIIAGYVARSGESILVVPRAEGFNLVAWLGPGIALVIAIAAVGLLLRRWRSRATGEPAILPAGPAPAPGDPDLARLRRAIDDLR